MAYNPIMSAAEKVEIVEAYLAGRLSPSAYSRERGIARKLIYEWVRIYKTEGAEAFSDVPKTRSYTPGFKAAVVEEYLSSGTSKRAVCSKYKIRSISVLERWILCYNDGKGILPSKERGARMKTTAGKKGLSLGRNGSTDSSAAVGCGAYEGCCANKPRRFRKGTKPESEMTETERLKARLKKKEAENYMLQMEVDALKKLAEIEGGRSRG